MFISSEKDLEDYICNNLEEFILFLKSILGENAEIDFLGRQIEIDGNRIDLLFRTKWENKDITYKRYTFLVVELKYRNAESKDIAQLSKYMNLIRDIGDILNEKYKSDDIDVMGLLLTSGLNNEVQEIQMNLDSIGTNDIYFASYNTNISYSMDSYTRREEYKNKITYDNRFLLKEGKECGKKENGRS